MSWRVLVVEDDADLREVTVNILTARGYEVHEAVDGEAAWTLLQQVGLRPAAIVLDLRMPILDGLELLKRMATRPALDQIPVVLVTAEVALAAEAAPWANELLRKPYSRADLLRVLEGFRTAAPGQLRPVGTTAAILEPR